MREASPVLLEPIMALEVNTPIEYQGDILGDISRRRGEVGAVTVDGPSCVIAAEVPLQALFDYAMDLRSLSKGRADHSMTPSRYATMPASMAESLPAG
jgi:elongation factor G